MWVFLNNAFLSIVAHREEPNMLMVRSRMAGDIEKTFPDAEVIRTDAADYRYRTTIQRRRVEEVMLNIVHNIGYDNFKSSIPAHETGRHDAYLDVWSVMLRYQHKEDDPWEYSLLSHPT